MFIRILVCTIIVSLRKAWCRAVSPMYRGGRTLALVRLACAIGSGLDTYLAGKTLGKLPICTHHMPHVDGWADMGKFST